MTQSSPTQINTEVGELEADCPHCEAANPVPVTITGMGDTQTHNLERLLTVSCVECNSKLGEYQLLYSSHSPQPTTD